MSGTSRRTLLAGSAGLLAVSLAPLARAAAPLAELLQQDFAGRPIETGRITLTVPPLAENGNSVALTVDVESPMTAADYVQRIDVYAPANPLARVITVHLGPAAGRARIATRIRLADTQTVSAVATLSDGRLFAAHADVLVTLAACIDVT